MLDQRLREPAAAVHLQLTRRPTIVRVDAPRFGRLILKEAEHSRLQLWMQMCLRLLHKEERQIGGVYSLQLHGDGSHVEEIGVAVSGVTEVLRRNAVIGELETEVSGNVDQPLVGRKPERGSLPAHSRGQRCKAYVHRAINLRQNLSRSFSFQALRNLIWIVVA